MGVTGLWTVVQPCARPIKLETLNKKRLAVDASIWIYQFLKAVRDKEGNALRNSHVVGFFRRICKLLFFGIKPVFVFDGGAPLLKRQTISGRKARREGRREDAVRTAGKLLAVQMQRRAEEDDRKRREERDRPVVDPTEEEVPDNPVYVDELQMTAQERQQNRTFKKKDAYHLPELDVSLAEMGAPNDPRIMSHEELEEYARQFHTGEDINLYDFSKIDFNSPFFLSLPASDRYNILNAARLRSRLRMGHSKEQLDSMFPDRMAFSRFQIARVAERNELTQRLMNINGMNGEDAMFGVNGGGRVAGEKGKEYVLVKNDGVEGGWALGVVSNKGEGERSKPIDVDRMGQEASSLVVEEEEWEDGGFEDVPIQGLNRLPEHAPAGPQSTSGRRGILDRRKALYETRQQEADGNTTARLPVEEDPTSLFLPQGLDQDSLEVEEDEMDGLFEDVIPPTREEDDEELQKAIAMSLESPSEEADFRSANATNGRAPSGPAIDKPLEFNQQNAKIGRNFAHQTNARAQLGFHSPTGITSSQETSSGDPGSSQQCPQVYRSPKPQNAPEPIAAIQRDEEPTSMNSSKPISISRPDGFDGPLPFEPLNFGKSILSRKKKPPGDGGGGFEKEPEKKAKPLPPWFSGDIREENAAQKRFDDNLNLEDGTSPEVSRARKHETLKRQQTGEVIDLEAPKDDADQVIEVISSGDEADDDLIIGEAVPIDPRLRTNDVADPTRAEPPTLAIPTNNLQAEKEGSEGRRPLPRPSVHGASDSDEPIEWEESDLEERAPTNQPKEDAEIPAGGSIQQASSPASSAEFEDVSAPSPLAQNHPSISAPSSPPIPSMPTEPTLETILPADDEEIYSDPDEENLMRQLATEAEEHARFSATLNPGSHLQSVEDYEKELRQLRNQQKKDRRDADEVSHIMVTECQQLLKLFGLPYITAPMEAEAQCAELVRLGIVDGIVTDDSDVFLFGGTRIYKNMFNQAKFVECYLSTDLEKEYSLTRSKLVSIAHLLGSDYTEGLPNVGPVTALEILSEFETLENFSNWWEVVQTGQPPTAEDRASPFRRKFRKNATKIFLPNGFPDKRVDYAYTNPEVDHDPSPFEWGVPDLDALRSFLMATIGWTQDRTDEVLVPVVKDMNRRENEGTQANITQFFGGGIGVGASAGKPTANDSFAPRRRVEKSQRMANALGRLHARARESTMGEGEAQDGENDNAAEGRANGNAPQVTTDVATEATQGNSRRPSPSKKRAAASDKADSEPEDDANEEYNAPKKAKKGKKSKRTTQKSK